MTTRTSGWNGESWRPHLLMPLVSMAIAAYWMVGPVSLSDTDLVDHFFVAGAYSLVVVIAHPARWENSLAFIILGAVSYVLLLQFWLLIGLLPAALVSLLPLPETYQTLLSLSFLPAIAAALYCALMKLLLAASYLSGRAVVVVSLLCSVAIYPFVMNEGRPVGHSIMLWWGLFALGLTVFRFRSRRHAEIWD